MCDVIGHQSSTILSLAVGVPRSVVACVTPERTLHYEVIDSSDLKHQSSDDSCREPAERSDWNTAQAPQSSVLPLDENLNI